MFVGRGLAILAVGLMASGACVVGVHSPGHTARVEQRFEVPEQSDVHLITFDGSIDVRTWDRGEVLVEVEKRGPTRDAVESIEVTADRTGNRVQVEARRPGGGETILGIGLHISRTARIIATVPRRANVLARTGDGSIRIDRVEGRVELRTGDGSVKGSALTGVLTIDTGDGSVTLQDVDGALDVRTGDGGVSVSGRLGAVRVRTGDGSVTLRADSGSLMRDDWDISTGDGGVVVYLPNEFSAELDASTRDGRVTADQDVTVGADKIDRRTLRGRLGSGGRTLKIRTGDGSIHLRVS